MRGTWHEQGRAGSSWVSRTGRCRWIPSWGCIVLLDLDLEARDLDLEARDLDLEARGLDLLLELVELSLNDADGATPELGIFDRASQVLLHHLLYTPDAAAILVRPTCHTSSVSSRLTAGYNNFGCRRHMNNFASSTTSL